MAQHVKIPRFDEAVVYQPSTAQQTFAFPFPFWGASDLIVRINGAELPPSAYDVEGFPIQFGQPVVGAFGSGAVTIRRAWASGWKVEIDRLVDPLRNTDFSKTGQLPPDTLNSDLDKATARDQDILRIARKALRLAEAVTPGEAPTPPPTANQSPYIKVPLTPGMAPSQTRDAIQAIIDTWAGVARILIPAGMWEIDREITQPSNSWISGAGRDLTTVRLANGTDRRWNVFTNASNDRTTGNLGDEGLVLENLSIDGNRTGTVAGALTWGHTSGCGVGWAAVSQGIVRHVNVKSMWNHGITIDGAIYGVGPTEYGVLPSRFIRVEDCEAWDCGDDQITTHYCDMVWLTRCVGRDSAGSKVPGNSNAIEIDDGSRNIFITDCAGYRCDCGIQIKGHNQQPAPYNVIVNGFRAVNNRYGVELRHTGWYGTQFEDDEDTILPGEGEDDEIIYSGSSATARNVLLANIEVIAPRSKTQDYPLPSGPWPAFPTHPADYCVRLRSYENVHIVNMKLSDGTLDLAGDHLPYEGLRNVPLRAYRGVRSVQIKNLSILGFADCPRGIYSSGSFGGGLTIDGFTALYGPSVAIYGTSGADQITVDNYNIINLEASASPDTPIYLGGKECSVGKGWYRHFDRGPSVRRGVRWVKDNTTSGGDPDGRPQPFLEFVTREGTGQDLGTGEGAKWAWYLNLKAPPAGLENVDHEVGYFGIQKAGSSDNSYLSEAVMAVVETSDALAEPRDVFKARYDGSLWMGYLPVHADNAAALVGGLTAGWSYRTAAGDVKVVV